MHLSRLQYTASGPDLRIIIVSSLLAVHGAGEDATGWAYVYVSNHKYTTKFI